MKKTIVTAGLVVLLAACQTKTTTTETPVDTVVAPVDTVVVDGGAGQATEGEVPKEIKK